MKIQSVKIKNFRSITDCSFEFNDLLALIGSNNNGKSNIVDAIEMLLAKTKANNEYDFKDKEQLIYIEINFIDLTSFEQQKAETYIDHDVLKLKKEFQYIEKPDGTPDSKSKLFFYKENQWSPAPATNPFIGGIFPEFYKVPAVKELKDETKIATTNNFGKFLDLLFDSDEYDFSNIDRLLNELNVELNRGDDVAPLVKGAKEIEEIFSEQFKDCNLSFKIDTPNRKGLISQMDIMANDGCETPLGSKGHGAQRAFIFSILLLYAKKLNKKLEDTEDKDKKDLIIAIEEPEIYLHPHQQKIIYKLFKKLISSQSDQIQIIYTTHSSYMVNIEDYQYLGLVTKEDVNIGTKIVQCTEDIFDGDEKQEFKAMCQFDPERNEMFFADKVILCEGDTEKYSLPIIFDKLGLNIIDKKISIVECGGKNGIPLFQKILNKFNEQTNLFKYVVFYDLDIPAQNPQDATHKQQLEDEALAKNNIINELLEDNKKYIFRPDFENHMSLSLGRKDKPYKASKTLFSQGEDEWPGHLKNFVRDNF